MFFLRKSCALYHPRCNLITSYSLTHRICTTVTVQKSKLPDDGQPYPFMSNFKQNKYKVEDSFKASNNYSWKYQPLVMFGSFAIFLFYFTIWRDEHDIDIAISKRLYEIDPGMEIQDLKRSIKKAKKRGTDTTEYEDRLNVLLAQRSR